MEDKCACCGEIIPDGNSVCPNCQVYQKQKNTVRIRVTKEPEGVFPAYMPAVGDIYEAEFVPAIGVTERRKRPTNAAFCIVDIRDKRIILRKGEYEIVGGSDNEN